jgi:hypothetical protein
MAKSVDVGSLIGKAAKRLLINPEAVEAFVWPDFNVIDMPPRVSFRVRGEVKGVTFFHNSWFPWNGNTEGAEIQK